METEAKQPETAKEEEQADAEVAKDEETEAKAGETESKEEPKATELDIDAELEKERKGRPDPNKAKEAFKKREEKREEDTDEEKPLTRKELEQILANERKLGVRDSVLTVAQSLTSNPKEAELLVLKWENRTFPSNLSLAEQMEEVYVITHKNKIIGENKELKRALRGKAGVNTNPAGTHQDPPKGTEPQLSPADAHAIKAAGFVWNGTSRQFEKKLKDGSTLIRDSKSKQVRRIK